MDWMDGNRRHMLERLVALLFIMAGIADRTVGQPAHARLRALGFLARGEVLAQDFIFGMAFDMCLTTPDAMPEPSDTADRLAWSFRALAMLLLAMLALAKRLARGLAGDTRSLADLLPAAPSAISAWHVPALPAPDTS